jgi:hypothetical protein
MRLRAVPQRNNTGVRIMYDTYIVFRIQNGSIDLLQAYSSKEEAIGNLHKLNESHPTTMFGVWPVIANFNKFTVDENGDLVFELPG